MGSTLGKKFEEKFKEDWEETVLGSFIFRLKDQMSGYKEVSKNPCDYICFNKPLLYLLELKTTQENTFSVKFRQYDYLIEYKGIKGVYAGVVIWFYKHDIVVYVPITTFEKLIAEGKKSFNIKYLENDEYEYYVIPSVKLRKFMKSDYSKLIEYCENKENSND